MVYNSSNQKGSRNVSKILAGKLMGKTNLSKPTGRYGDNINMVHKEIVLMR